MNQGTNVGTAIAILVLCIVAFFALGWLRFKKPGNASQPEERAALQSRPTPAQMPTVPVAAFAWPVLDEYDFEVVGESNYQPVIKALMGDPNDPAMDGRGTAILVPEDTNPHDNKAVKVTAQGYTIGYLSRDDARSFRRRLAAKKLGMVPSSCGMQITGGYSMDDGSQAYYGVVLDLKPFDS